MKQELLKKLLHYNKNTGVFRWKIAKARRLKVNSVAGSLGVDGYIRIKINYKLYTAHRLAWLYIHGELPKKETDHKNHNRSDNRIKNIRVVERTENHKNHKISKANTSGIAGVNWNKRNKKWKAYIRINGKLKHLGYFVNIKKAKEARKRAKIEYRF